MSHHDIHKLKSKGYLSDLSGFAFSNSDLGIFSLPARTPPWRPLPPDCPRPGIDCGCSACIICPGQRNVPSHAPTWAGWGSLLSFSSGDQPCTSFHWKHFPRHSFRISAITINWPLDSITLLYSSLSPNLSFSALQSQ